MTCPLSGTGNEILDVVHEKILRFRSEGELDWANGWSNYLHAIHAGNLSSYHFDDCLHPQGPRTSIVLEMATFGGFHDDEHTMDMMLDLARDNPLGAPPE